MYYISISMYNIIPSLYVFLIRYLFYRTGQDILFVLSIVNEQYVENDIVILGIATQKR